jgi:hypothetical protein
MLIRQIATVLPVLVTDKQAVRANILTRQPASLPVSLSIEEQVILTRPHTHQDISVAAPDYAQDVRARLVSPQIKVLMNPF